MKVVRAMLFWLGFALGVIGLSGLDSAVNPDAPTATSYLEAVMNPEINCEDYVRARRAEGFIVTGRWINGEPSPAMSLAGRQLLFRGSAGRARPPGDRARAIRRDPCQSQRRLNMSAFCVLGMTFDAALKRAEKKVRDDYLKDPGRGEAKPGEPSLRRTAVREGLDRCRPEDVSHPCIKGHGSQTQEGQTRQSSDQQDQWPPRRSARNRADIACLNCLVVMALAFLSGPR